MARELRGWRDLRLAVSGSASGAGTPSLAAFGTTGNIKQLSFGVGDSIYLAGHIDHDIFLGDNVYPHVHWTTNGTNVNTVKWQMNCVIAKGHDQDNFGADVVIEIEEAAAGTAWRHMITEDATGFDPLEVDSLWIVELKRITNGGTDNTDTVFAMFVDIHYQVQQYATPNKVPDFYT